LVVLGAKRSEHAKKLRPFFRGKVMEGFGNLPDSAVLLFLGIAGARSSASV